jgi:hypothetical protein
MAKDDGHPNPNGSILWVEQVKPRLWEVVICDGVVTIGGEAIAEGHMEIT